MSAAQIKNARSSLELNQAQDLYDTTVSAAKEQLRALETNTAIKISQEVRDAAMHAPSLAIALQRVANTTTQGKLLQAQIKDLEKTGVLKQLEINMRHLGLSYNDSVILRVLAQFAQGDALPKVVQSLWQKITDLAKQAGETVVGEVTNNVTSVK